MEYLFLIILYALIMFILLLTFLFGPDRTSQIIFFGPLIAIYGGYAIVMILMLISLTFTILQSIYSYMGRQLMSYWHSIKPANYLQRRLDGSKEPTPGDRA